MRASWCLPAVIAHRCGGALAPENTLAGLHITAALGLRGVEFDVMLSADGVPVVIHDDELDRTTSCSGPVAGMSARDLAACDAGWRHHAAFAGEPIPSLAALAASCLGLGLAANLEIKCDDAAGTQIGSVVARAAAELWAGAPSQLLFSSFSERALEAARRAAPQIARGLLVEVLPADWLARTARLGCVSLHCDARRLDEARVAELRRAGLRLALYTENDAARARRWLALGADAIFTDRPDRMLALAAEGAVFDGDRSLP